MAAFLEWIGNLAISLLGWVAGILYGEEHDKRTQAEAVNAELHRQLDIASRPDRPVDDLLGSMRDGKL